MPSDYDGLTEKSRALSPGHRVYRQGYQGGTNGSPTYVRYESNFGNGRQVTLSDGHPWPPHKRGRLEDVGGPFKTTRMYVTNELGGEPLRWDSFPYHVVSSARWLDPPSANNVYPVGYSYEGVFLPTSPGTDLTNYWGSRPSMASSEQLLRSLGTTAISRCKPTNPTANLSTALGELFREGLPKAPGVTTWKSRTEIAKGAGSEYLNTVFGWLPLASDIQDVAKAASRQDEIWRQYRRDSGRVVRRRYVFPTDKTSSLYSRKTGVYPSPSGNIYTWASSGTLSVIRHTERRRWFSGAFTYYLPKAEGEGSFGKWFRSLQKLKAVYGLTLDPELVYNLTPWSWAVDWFSNTGDVISNVSDIITDNLVMHYGYMMEHVVETDEISLVGARPVKGTDTSDLRLYVVRETKQRLRASPYGFGLTWESFSPRQLAILAALGITR